MPGIGVIHNPLSKKNMLDPGGIQRLGYLLGEKAHSRTTRSLDELSECLREFEARKIDILAVNGGDGSLHVVLTRLIAMRGNSRAPLPMLAILRGGTLNTVARSFNIWGRPEESLYNISAKYGEGIPLRTAEARLLKVNGRYSFIFGNGLVANFLNTYYTTGTTSSAHGVKTLFRGVGSWAAGTPLAKGWFRKIEARVTVDERPLPIAQFSSILAATIEDIGVGFKPFCRAFETTEHFHILFYTCTPGQVVSELPNIYLGRPMSPVLGTDTLARHVVIKASQPFHYTQDGDMYMCENGRMDISIGPKVTIIVE